ncbi:MAG: hypothetical protein P8L37_02420 [Phycisphaerales bacterium]|nr:hypothetical protein [Phycisphaerales bacterium]
MAIRSSAGTGVIVSLVVFILISIFLLVMSILFYSGKTEAINESKTMAAQLDEYARPNERNAEALNAVKDAAKKDRKSVLGFVLDQHNSMKTWVDGNPNSSVDSIKRRFDTFGDGTTLYNSMKNMSRQLADSGNELTSLKERIAALQAEHDGLMAQVEAANRARDTLLAAESKQLETYRTATDEHLGEIAQVREKMETASDKLRDRYTDEIKQLQDEGDALRHDTVGLKSRIEELEAYRSENRLKPPDPATLVDGRVIDIAGSNNQVYVDRGQQDQIVLGMTFEVYDDASQIRRQADGQFPRGKASLQIIKVGQNTSTAKITRSTFGRPVVREDVIVNAIYDPNYKFKFLVHGQFDIDGDGRPTEEDAAYLRSQIENWGGIVMHGETLPGDLDFLVLGVTPPDPPRPAQDASMLQQQDYIRQKTIFHTYQKLSEQAQNAKIPTLNATRLHILTGGTGL